MFEYNWMELSTDTGVACVICTKKSNWSSGAYFSLYFQQALKSAYCIAPRVHVGAELTSMTEIQLMILLSLRP